MKSKIICIFTAMFALAALPASASKPAGKAPERTVTAAEAAEEELSYAAISKTNPFEIVPAAGMEILDLSDDGAEWASDMIEFARKFIGTRYRRGGKAPGGFDCSGFTSYVFSQFGFSLSPSSSGQYGQGESIGRDEVSAGDLLFFTGRNSGNRRVGHVGIAIDNDPVTGEITFIHAAITGGIRIDRISAPYYAARYLGARRVR
ncbi:MAG: C40 family peptidase [Muribaculaceae bacterium]|nr:C40 family peptidase [Muribaculaceae bacterium]